MQRDRPRLNVIQPNTNYSLQSGKLKKSPLYKKTRETIQTFKIY